MIKRLLCLVLSFVLMLGSLSGCNHSNEPKESITKNVKTAEEKSLSSLIPYKGDPIKIKALVYSAGADVERGDGQILQKEYDKRIGNVEWQWESPLASEYSTKLQLYLASGDLPDIFNFNFDTKITKPGIIEFGNQGLLMDWTPYVEKMENFKKFAGTDDFDAAKRNMVDGSGHMYYLTEVGQVLNTTGWLLRDDIFKKYANRVPDTIDELYEDLLKIKSANPKSYPFGSSQFNATIRAMAVNYGSFDEFFYDYSKKKWLYGPMEEGYKSGLQQLNKFYDAKLLDPEFPSMTQDMYEKRVAAGDIVASYWYNWGKMENAAKSTGTPFSYAMKFLKINNVRKQAVFPWVHYWADTAISNKSKYKDLLVSIMDYQYSLEMIDLYHYGVEGVTYDKDKNGKKVMQPWIKSSSNPNGTTEARQVGLHGKLGIRYKAYLADPTYEGMAPYTKEGFLGLDKLLFDKDLKPTGDVGYVIRIQPTLTKEEYDELNKNLTLLNGYVKEYTTKFITGAIGFDKWNEYVEGMKKFNIQTLVDNFNKAEARVK